MTRGSGWRHRPTGIPRVVGLWLTLLLAGCATDPSTSPSPSTTSDRGGTSRERLTHASRYHVSESIETRGSTHFHAATGVVMDLEKDPSAGGIQPYRIPVHAAAVTIQGLDEPIVGHKDESPPHEEVTRDLTTEALASRELAPLMGLFAPAIEGPFAPIPDGESEMVIPLFVRQPGTRAVPERAAMRVHRRDLGGHVMVELESGPLHFEIAGPGGARVSATFQAVALLDERARQVEHWVWELEGTVGGDDERFAHRVAIFRVGTEDLEPAGALDAYRELEAAYRSLGGAREAPDHPSEVRPPSWAGQVFLVARTACVASAAAAERGTNPLPILAIVGAVHLADSLIELGTDLYADYREGNPRWYIPDGDGTSLLKKYVYEPGAEGILTGVFGLDERYSHIVGDITCDVVGILSPAPISQAVGLSARALHLSAKTTAMLKTGAKVIQAALQAKQIVTLLKDSAALGEAVAQDSEAGGRSPLAGTSPARLLVIMDRSGSMGDEGPAGVPRMAHARKALGLIAGELSPADEVGLLVFDDRTEEIWPIQPMGRHRQAFLDAVDRVQPRGGTRFARALSSAQRIVTAAGHPPPTVLFISDGEDNTGGIEEAAASLCATGAMLHAVPVGDAAGESRLADLAARCGGRCVAASDEGIQQALGHLTRSARGYVDLASIRDVIRPGEVQTIQLSLPRGGSDAVLELTGTWAGSDLSFAARSPSGVYYSTESPGPGGETAGSARESYRVLRIPAEMGQWSFEALARDVPDRGEPYMLSISAALGKTLPSVRPLLETHDPGDRVEVVIEDCPSDGAAGTFYGAGGRATPFDLLRDSSDRRCRGEVELPDQPGMYPIAVAVDGGAATRMWTTAQVGDDRQVVRSRDTWRRTGRPWARRADDGSGWAYGMLAVVAIVLIVALTRGRPHGSSRESVLPKDGHRPAASSGGQLLVREASGASRHLPLRAPVLRIGRAPDNDIVLADRHVSRYHAVIRRDPRGSLVLINAAGPGAVRVGQRDVGRGQAVDLLPGREVRLAGGVWLTYLEEVAGGPR